MVVLLVCGVLSLLLSKLLLEATTLSVGAFTKENGFKWIFVENGNFGNFGKAVRYSFCAQRDAG
jgi:hypothetical protein